MDADHEICFDDVVLLQGQTAMLARFKGVQTAMAPQDGRKFVWSQQLSDFFARFLMDTPACLSLPLDSVVVPPEY
jgi:hypothetical protein